MDRVDTRDLTAADIMHRECICVGVSDSLQVALSLMTEHFVSGLPVIGAGDHCVGVVSATDVLRFEQDQTEFNERAGNDYASYFNTETQHWESICLGRPLDELSELPVSEVMSRDLLQVSPETPILEVASLMNFRQVHRVLVIDDENCLQGIISSMDFVRLCAEGII